MPRRAQTPGPLRRWGGDTRAAQPVRWTPTVRSFVTDDNHVLYHWWTLICGLSLVVPLCVGLLQRFPLHFRYRPSGLGIVSVTTLANYPVREETYGYALALIVLMVVPGLLWLGWLVFSLSLARVLGRDFGTVATRGCWALSLAVLLFPYALIRPEVAFALSVAAVVAMLLLQVFLVLTFPQGVDFELPELPRLEKLAPWRRLGGGAGRQLDRFFLVGVALSWVLYLALSGHGEGAKSVMTVMTLLVLALPILFAAGWVALCRRWLDGREVSPVNLALLLSGGLAVDAYLFVVGGAEVMLAALALCAGLLLWWEIAPRMAGAALKLKIPVVLLTLAFVVAGLAATTFDGTSFTRQGSLNADYLREDGAHLAWANRILHGELQGRDFYSMYGPLLDYGLVAVMKVVGVRSEAAPLYWWLGRVAGAVAAALLLYELTGSAGFSVLGLLVFHLGVGWRTAFALATLAAFVRFSSTMRLRWALAAGVLGGLALGVSHEFGLCALAACVAGTLVLAWRYEARWLAGKALATLAGGVALPLAAGFVYFALAGNLAALLHDLVNHPRYVMMGYGNLPFPDVFRALAEAGPVWEVIRKLFRGGRLSWGLPIIVYVVTLDLVLFRFVMRKSSSRDFGALLVIVFGVLSFRVALARSDALHLHLVMPIPIVLLFWHVWLLLGRLGSTVNRRVLRLVNVVEFGVFVGAALFLVDALTLSGIRVAVVGEQVARLGEEIRLVAQELPAPSQIRRVDIPLGETNTVADVVRYVHAHTRPQDPILAVPNMPVFYFLTDRLNPTRFEALAQLVTNEQRVEAFRDFQKRPPALVLFHGGENNIDRIPPSRQFPNLLNAIVTSYTRAAKFGPIYLLRPRSPGAAPAAEALLWAGSDRLGLWHVGGNEERVARESEGWFIRRGGRPVTLSIDLEGVLGQRYRTLRVKMKTGYSGSLRVGWITRELLDADETTGAELPFYSTGREPAHLDLDLRNYPSWLFNHVEQLSITVPARYSMRLSSIELLPMEKVAPLP